MGSFVQECRDLSALSPTMHMVVVCIAVYHRNSVAAERRPKRAVVGMIRAPRNLLAIRLILSDRATLIEFYDLVSRRFAGLFEFSSHLNSFTLHVSWLAGGVRLAADTHR